MTRKLSAGSRKVRQDLFAEAIGKHNRVATGKAKINPDETSALYFFDQAPASIRRALKIIWGTEAPQHTAVPLSLIAQPFWFPKKSLSNKIGAQANPLWHEIATHSWPKMEELLKRLEGKWNYKCQEYLARGINPPVYSPLACSQFRDAGKEAEIALMACFMVHFEKDMKEKLGPQEFARIHTAWITGHLDNKLLPEITAMRPDFNLADCGFIQSAGLQATDQLPPDFELDEEEEEKVRNLVSLTRVLKKEQEDMRSHRAVAQRHQVQTLAAECEWQTSVKQAVDRVWEEHAVFFQTQACKSLSAAQAIAHTAHRSVAGRLLKEVSQIPVIGVVNIPMLGANASTLLRSIVTHIGQEIAQAPALMIYILIPPNQPQHGTGKASKAERERKVEGHIALWQAELQSQDTLHILPAKILFDQETMYSDDRDLGTDIWIIISSSIVENIQSGNIFGSSVLLKRKAVPGLVHAMPRSQMANFCKDLSFATAGKTHGDADVERRQWLSGHSFFSDLLQAAFKGTKLHNKNTVLIRDDTLYDAELGLAVAKMNGLAQKPWPNLAYVGTCWHANSQVRDVIQGNVKTVLEEQVKGAISRSEYAMGQLPLSLQQKPTSGLQASSGPVLQSDKFELTCPTPRLELAWLSSTIQRGERCGKVVLPESETWKGLAWKDIQKLHEDEFNPSGAVRNKRDAEVPVDQLLACISAMHFGILES